METLIKSFDHQYKRNDSLGQLRGANGQGRKRLFRCVGYNRIGQQHMACKYVCCNSSPRKKRKKKKTNTEQRLFFQKSNVKIVASVTTTHVPSMIQ